MKTLTTRTLSGLGDWNAAASAETGAMPCVRLLYSVDLDRIRSLPVCPLSPSGDWTTIGRSEPLFAGNRGRARPLDDPFTSRRQLDLRWCAGSHWFEVMVCPEAKRTVRLIDLAAGDRAAIEVAAGTVMRVPPGTGILIGDRALLGLALARAREQDLESSPLIGECEAIVTLREQIRRLATFERPVLILGPTGVGKELVAQALHSSGPRASRPFITANCAALPEPLVESVLFGHRRGAFTGADSDQIGLIAAADGGTLFLDEVGELPASIQPKLLRVLENGIVVPVGAQEGRRVDVRIVAATNRDPQADVASGRWREDLYHRLAGHVLRVPALRDRRFDVPALFTQFLAELSARHGELAWLWQAGADWRPTIPVSFFTDLMAMTWGGNVRELRNVAERVAFLNPEAGTFRAPEEVALPASTPEGERPAVSGGGTSREVMSVASTLGIAPKTLMRILPPARIVELWAELESQPEDDRRPRVRAQVADALYAWLERTDFNQTTLAAELGMSRTTLITMMQDLGLPRAIDLADETIAAAQAAAGGDVDRAARQLRVSPRALRRRLGLPR